MATVVYIDAVAADGIDLVAYYDADGSFEAIEGIIQGPPVPKPPPRSSTRGHMYNPLRTKMDAARNKLRRLLTAEGLLDGDRLTLFADPTTPLKLTATYYMRRPNSEFINNNRWNPLKTTARHCNSVVHTDGDNLTKYLMDIFTGVIYPDDKQVSTWFLDRVLHSEGSCDGQTVFKLEKKL